MPDRPTLVEGQVLTGPLFIEPMRVVTVRSHGNDTWDVGLVGVNCAQGFVCRREMSQIEDVQTTLPLPRRFVAQAAIFDSQSFAV